MSSKNLINGNQKLLNVSKAAKLLSVSPKTIRRWAQSKKINGLKVGLRGDWRFTKDNLLDMVKPNKKKDESK